MATYATKQDLLDRDEQMLWNFAVDRTTNELNDTWINQALDQADEEIDSFLGRRYVLPLPTVPGMLNKIAITIAFYWLADRDQQATNLLEERYKMQLETLREQAVQVIGLEELKRYEEIIATLGNPKHKAELLESPWADWSPSYAKTRHGNQSLLQGGGDLLDSITFVVQRNQVRIGSPLPYSGVHQDGFSGAVQVDAHQEEVYAVIGDFWKELLP